MHARFFINERKIKKMGKDPAVLFYTADFLVGTETFTFADKGRYIHLLCVQHQTGHMSTEYVLKITDSPSSPVWGKFIKDQDGLWFNERMDEEKEKRVNYSNSRRENVSKRYQSTYEGTYEGAMKLHMENENENEDVNKDVDIKLKPVVFNFDLVWAKYPNKDGRKAAERYFHASVKTPEDFEAINQALENYLKSDKVKNNFIKNGSTWFNNWKDWITYVPPAAKQGKPPAEMVAVTCRAQRMSREETKAHILKEGYSEQRAVEAVQQAFDGALT